ncbi:MAG: transporter substrate-binding domain-containing protein [Gammaproteobacteria bacterium]|nr:transporter substrate-binding domain-containing protein [Gammaproteobacteria bacterium]
MKTTILWFLTIFCLTACNPNNEQANTKPTATPPASTSGAPATTPPATEPQANTAPDANCLLRLGFEAWEPYQFMGLDNKASGLDVELMQAVAHEMNCQLEMKQGTWVDLMTQLKSGDVDLLLGASVTPAREEFAYFSKPYRKEQFVMFVRSAASASLPQTTLDEFLAAGKKVGIVSEYYYGAEFATLLSDEKFKAQFVEASLSELNVARLLDEEIDGMIEDSFVARSMLRRKGLEQQIGRHSIELSSGDVFVMFSKKSVTSQQVGAFNDALTAIAKNGKYQEILDKYQQ